MMRGIRGYLSRYHPRYPRALVYMLQASEYNIRDYFAWYRRTNDFLHVERRKYLVKTPKALLMLGIGWVLLLSLYGAAFTIGLRTHVLFAISFGAVIFFLAPFLVAYLIIIPLGIIQFFVQRPLEYFLFKQTQQQLARHRAIKIAIAGSFGKTTMREILKTVLSEGKKATAPQESRNTPMGISRFIQTLTGDKEVLIFELGEYYPGDVRVLCRLVQPDIGVITGINEAHLKKFKTVERAAKTIYELADWIGEGPVYVNGENALAREHARPGHILYSRDGLGNWRIENPKTDLTGTSFSLVKNGVRLECASRLLGLHHIGSLAAAADIALRLGLSPEQIKNGIAKTQPFPHRLQATTDQTGVITLDDSYNGNPDGVAAGIAFLASLHGHQRWYVTPGLVEMGVRTEAVHRAIGKELADAKIEKIVLIENSVTPYIEKGLKENGYGGEVVWFDDALAAFAALPHFTAAGDVVLLQNDWPDQY